MILGGLVVIGIVCISGCKNDEVEYETRRIVKGDVVQKITASGTINPISTVNIGTQVSGIIAEIRLFTTSFKQNHTAVERR